MKIILTVNADINVPNAKEFRTTWIATIRKFIRAVYFFLEFYKSNQEKL